MPERLCVGRVMVSTGVVVIELYVVPTETTARSQLLAENPVPLIAEGNAKVRPERPLCRLADFIRIIRIF